ncbi:MAG: hypothetical protein KJP03_09000 [Gammaproteobacteria bacterium]|nr:hypothetical protein [Gammaproteobacteria bacterium]
MKRNGFFFGMALAGIFMLFIEVVSFVAATILLPTGLLVAKPDTDGYEEYLLERDPVLGWPSKNVFGTGEYDVSGSRIVPAFPDPSADSCVALFGDSFTWGDEVTPEFAYGNVLAELLDCRVANYGTGGYGTDQAVLRYVDVIDDNAPVVVMGHFADNITRNVNQLRDFVAGGRFGFKPRFVLDDEGLRLVPLPSLTVTEYAEAAERAAELLPYEYFRPGTWGAAGIKQLPYTKAVLHAALHYRVLAAVSGIRPTYAPFYESDHPSGALPVTVAMLNYGADIAATRAQRFVVLLIPDQHDLAAASRGEPTSYAALRDALHDSGTGVEVVDAADYLTMAFEGDDFCELFVTCGASHFNPAGYRLLAEAVHSRLTVGD